MGGPISLGPCKVPKDQPSTNDVALEVDNDSIVAYLTAESIESAYISPVMDLYKEQCAKELNRYPNPRGQARPKHNCSSQ